MSTPSIPLLYSSLGETMRARNRGVVGANGEKSGLEIEMESVQRIQDGLFPAKLPSISGLDIGVMYHPALQVGGDFYDFIEKPGKPLFFAIGDVSGKGMAAAMLMAMTRTAVRAYANLSPLPTPEAVVSDTNAQLYGDFTAVNAIATLFTGQYEPIQRTLVYANAGHSPVVFRPANGAARLLQADGTALGVMPTTFSRNQWLTFQPGDMLIVGTDGLVESRDKDGQWFGYDQLLTLADTLAVQPAQAVAEALHQVVETFSCGKKREDDQTVVVFKCSIA